MVIVRSQTTLIDTDTAIAKMAPLHQTFGKPIFMASARAQCPECGGSRDIVDLADVLYSPKVDFFRCRACGCWWMVPKGADEPATRAVLGNAHSSVMSQKAG